VKAQQDMFGTNDPRLMDTLIRIAKINQLRKSAEIGSSQRSLSASSEFTAQAMSA
jgi:hypothetical protein